MSRFHSAPAWRRVEDQLPEVDDLYLVCYKPGAHPDELTRGTAKWSVEVNRFWLLFPYGMQPITHWMPYPELPWEEEAKVQAWKDELGLNWGKEHAQAE